MAEEAKRDEQVKAVWFAAGTAVLMACVERAMVVSLFAHWRVWAFLVLNLLLLAILFTSKSHTRDGNGAADPERDKQKKILSQASAGVIARVENHQTKIKCEEEAQFELSKEELNQRVEKFIAMFRQHLVSDSKSFNCSSKTT